MQTYLESQGHEVLIINYKPKCYDNTLWAYFRNRKFLSHSLYKQGLKMESSLSEFRAKYLHLSDRITRFSDLSLACQDLDCLLSGSDQVLNPSFLLNGEGRNRSSAAYFLNFSFSGHKIAYAASFGCTEYPIDVLPFAKTLIHNFDRISVRENSGINIVKSMGREDVVIVPDPTLLLSKEVYDRLADVSVFKSFSDFVYCFFIRNISERKNSISSIGLKSDLIWNNEDYSFGVYDWLQKIRSAKFVITDSFHCVVMCLKLHISFAVVTEKCGNVGMNDRFYSLLSPISLSDRIVFYKDIDNVKTFLSSHINWDIVDEYFLNSVLKANDFLINENYSIK